MVKTRPLWEEEKNFVKRAYRNAKIASKRSGKNASLNGHPLRLRVGKRIFYLSFWKSTSTKRDILAARKLGFETRTVGDAIFLRKR